VIDRPLRLLVVSSPPPLKRLPELYLGLLDSGAELVFAGKPEDVPEPIRTAGGRTVELPLVRGDEDAAAVRLLRAAADLNRYLGPELADARWPRTRATRRLLKLAGYPHANRISREAADFRLPDSVQARLRDLFRGLEGRLAPPPGLETAVAELELDAVLLVSRFLLGGPEPDVVKVARRLGLPSMLLVWSWDNLSSKAVLNEHPDRLFVWNELQAREAEELHGIAPERIRVVGAANFDRFFEALRAVPPARPAERKSLLYLGSSPKVAPDEPAIFDRWLAAVRASSDARLRDARVVLRPHPAAAEPWARWVPPAGVEVAEPRAKLEQAELARRLVEADAVVALNTSAEIEAAIAGRPVLTFRAGPEARGQEGSVHFTYLLEQSGGFVLDAAGVDEHVAALSAVLGGEHDPEPALRFVERFVRPAGLETAVTPLAVAAILEGAAEARPAAGGGTVEPAVEPKGDQARILVLSPHGLARSVPDVFLDLIAGGAELVFSGRRADRLRLPPEIKSHAAVEVVSLPLVGDDRADVDVLRAFRDAVRFRDESLEDASWPRRRATRRLLRLLGHPDWKAALTALDSLRLPPGVWEQLDGPLAELERLVPAREELVRAVAAQRPDALLVVTRCTLDTYEPDALKAARALGIPATMLIWSWDNLSSKAVLHERPDRLIVWNEVQAEEAVRLHGLGPERVVVAGAANFDRFFAEVEETGDARGERPTIVYLGSSTNVAPHEPEIFERWLAAVRASDDPTLRDAQVLVRPHPAGKAWLGWAPSDPAVRLERAESKSDSGRLALLLARAHAVVALNTSAELEAAIARRPVLTFRAGPDAPGQEGSHHFRYLLEADGGFVLDSATLTEHAGRLARVLRGDYDHVAIDRFVERFVRPGGLDVPVAPVVASAVLELVRVRVPVRA
jgi:hypothetical protein